MSRFSGKCDLYDHIAGSGGWFDKEGNSVKFGDPNVHVLYSDEYKDFLEFKKRTGGILYQHRVLKVTPWNHDDAMRLCPELEVIEHKKVVPDKRQKSGQREDVYYTYKYWGKEYTLKELNKRKVYITIEIHFDTLLDLIPYYPYIVCMSGFNDGKQTVYIASQSFVDEELEDHLEGGWYSDCWQIYKKELQDHYREIVLEYFNPIGREVKEQITFKKETMEDGSTKYIGRTSYSMDENFNPKWTTNKPRWTSPKIIDEHRIEMSEDDFENYLGATQEVYYVKKKEYELNLE